ncbi:MAG: transporter substrate-binding domain-containing protein [Caldilineaceae bacterium]|nr:transporter substrate-binding domain-containing protein [Caldilineaceae bacterium]
MKQARPIFFWIAMAALVLALAPLAAIAAPPGQAATPTPDPAPSAAATATASGDDWARVQAAGKLVVGTAADYVPFAFYNSQFQLDGFDIKLAEALGQKMGVTVEFKDFAFDGLLDAMNLGQIDAAIGAISVTPERQQAVDFSNIYHIGSDAALMRANDLATISSAADLAGKKIGVEQGTTYQTWVQRNAVDTGILAQDDLTVYVDTTSMLRDLRNGTIDVALMGLLPAQDTVSRFPDVAIAGSDFNRQQLAIAAPKGSSLLEPLNAALLAVQADGTYAQLVASYLQPSADPGADEQTVATPVATLPATPAEAPAAEATATPAPAPAATVAPATAPCTDGMAFIEDVTFDDHNMSAPPVFQPSTPFVKIWRMQNIGTCTWDTGYQLAFVSGNQPGADMGGTAVPMAQNVPPGATVDIAASLRAPSTYGTFQGFWKMRNSQGQSFGQVVWVGIQVPDPNPPPPPPPPPPPNGNPNLRADANTISAGQCTTIRWDIDGVSAVYFIDGGNSQGVGGHDSRNVCPGGTTTYTLRVVYTNNTSSDFPITINVSGAPSYSVNFWADSDQIRKGECTTLHWDVRNVQAVYLDGNGVAGQGSQQECPRGDKTYKLTVVRQDGGQEEHKVKIHVKDGGAVPPAPGPVVPM